MHPQQLSNRTPFTFMLPHSSAAGELSSDDDFYLLDTGLVVLQVRCRQHACQARCAGHPHPISHPHITPRTPHKNVHVRVLSPSFMQTTNSIYNTSLYGLLTPQVRAWTCEAQCEGGGADGCTCDGAGGVCHEYSAILVGHPTHALPPCSPC